MCAPRMGIRKVSAESSLGALWINEYLKLLHAYNQDSDQTNRMRRLIRVFAGSLCEFVSFVVLRLGNENTDTDKSTD